MHIQPSVKKMEKLPQHHLYSSYSYHVALLKDFADVGAEEEGRCTAGSGRRASTAVPSTKTKNVYRSSSIIKPKRRVQHKRAQSVAVLSIP
jgi:hypothetical protein